MLKRPFSKAATSAEASRYRLHFVWAVRPFTGSLRTEKALQVSDFRGTPLNVEPLSDARTMLADFFSIMR